MPKFESQFYNTVTILATALVFMFSLFFATGAYYSDMSDRALIKSGVLAAFTNEVSSNVRQAEIVISQYDKDKHISIPPAFQTVAYEGMINNGILPLFESRETPDKIQDLYVTIEKYQTIKDSGLDKAAKDYLYNDLANNIMNQTKAIQENGKIDASSLDISDMVWVNRFGLASAITLVAIGILTGWPILKRIKKRHTTPKTSLLQKLRNMLHRKSS